MKVKANPAGARIRQRISESSGLMITWRGAAYRATTLEYPRAEEILMGQGSFLHGGRWNAIGSFRAVYGSTSDVVAVAESRATADYAGIPHPFRTPRLLVTIELDLAKVLNLSHLETLHALELSSDELRLEDWRKVQEHGDESLSQAIGRACFEEGANGLLVPSARVREGVNVVYFPENQLNKSEAKVCEAEKLDRIRHPDER